MNLGNYYSNKTVKLSDSYVVYIHNLQQRSEYNSMIAKYKTGKNLWDPNGNIGDLFNTIQNSNYTDSRLVELYNCTEVKLPAYRYKVESHQIGNNIYKAILPDYEAKPTLTLTLAEDENYSVEALLNLIIRRNVKDAGTYDMQYVDNGWIDILAVDVLSNDLHIPVLRYQFGFCRLVDYSVMDLNYSTDALPTYSMTFTFETYEKVYNPKNINDLVLDTRNRIGAIVDSYNSLSNSSPLTDAQKSSGIPEQPKKEEPAKTDTKTKKKAAKKKVNPAKAIAQTSTSDQLKALKGNVTYAEEKIHKTVTDDQLVDEKTATAELM